MGKEMCTCISYLAPPLGTDPKCPVHGDEEHPLKQHQVTVHTNSFATCSCRPNAYFYVNVPVLSEIRCPWAALTGEDGVDRE